MIGSLYVITNKVNGKQYVGKTYGTIESRFKAHIHTAKRNYATNRPLYKAFVKYGLDNFSIHEIGKYEEGILEQEEIECIKELGTFRKGYNLTLGGDGARYLVLDSKEVVTVYKQLKTMTATAKQFNCFVGTIRKILMSENIQITKPCDMVKRKVLLVEKGLIFESLVEAARYIIKEKLSTTDKEKCVQRVISRVVNKVRKTAYGFNWQPVNT